MKFILLVLMSIIFFSCDKEASLTEGEINAQKISMVVNEHNLTKVNISYLLIGYDSYGSYSRWETRQFNADFKIEGSFIIVNSDYYNLAKLDYFTFSGITLELYLK